MAQVPIPWFHGGPVVSAGKALKKERMLNSLSQGMFSVGRLLRAERSQGLPKGATDEDLANEETALEAQLGESQGRATADAEHGIETAQKSGDHHTAAVIADDPGGYAAGQQAGKDSFLPKLGGFVKGGLERLLWGDPQRAQRVAHIQRMRGELEFEKSRMNFIKTAVPIAARSENPDEALRAMGGDRFHISHIPKQTLTKSQRGVGAGGDIYVPGSSGGATDKGWITRAYDIVRQRHNGVVPGDDDPEGQAKFRDEVIETATTLKDAHQAGVDKTKRDNANQTFADHLKLKDEYRRKAKAEKDAETGGGGKTVTEKDVPFDEQGNRLSPQDATKRRAQGKPVVTKNVVTRSQTPLHPKDPGLEIGAPPFLAP